MMAAGVGGEGDGCWCGWGGVMAAGVGGEG